MNKCIICKKKEFKVVWNDKIRSSSNKFSKKKEKILQCKFCELVFLEKPKKYLENSAITRNLYNKNNSIKEFLDFHSNREKNKLKFIENYVNFKNKKILESNCGAGILLHALKRKALKTAGLDNNHYKNFVVSQGHQFYSNISQMLKNQDRFDIILSLSEIEHKYNPIKFIKDIKKCLTKNGFVVFRIPNFFNIYMYALNKSFLKYDYRASHNYYFSEKNLDLMFNNLDMKIVHKLGYHEYSLNHLFTYIKTQKRVDINKIKTIFTKNDEKNFKLSVEKTMSSTSLIYILKNN
jgi:2-polyprenyl-3-methyl-5-hydroxy-6-metoxy-1,4-benzoquinol methylase